MLFCCSWQLVKTDQVYLLSLGWCIHLVVAPVS